MKNQLLFKKFQHFVFKSILCILFLVCSFNGNQSYAQVNHLVITQVYGGGNNTGATYQNDFVELFNPTASSQNLTGWSIQYSSATGTTAWAVATLSGSIGPGNYYLVKLAGGTTNGAVLPTADATNTGINLSASAGKVALVNNTTALTGAGGCAAGSVIDVIGFGSTANCSETSPASASGAGNATSFRRINKCLDGNNNSLDFTVETVVVANNSATPASSCLTPEINLKQNTTSIATNGSYDFGSFTTGTPSSSITFTIENTGTALLNLTGSPNLVAISGTNPSDFAITQPGSSSVAASGSTTFSIIFTPGGTGSRAAQISIANNDADENPYTITLSGTGNAPSSPEINIKQNITNIISGTGSYDFGLQQSGTSSSAVTFTIENTGTGTLNLSGTPNLVAKSGIYAGQFSIVQPGSSTVAPGGSATFTITFNPALPAGVKTATISIANDDTDENPYTFTVSGTSTAPEINVKQGTTNIASATGIYNFGPVVSGSSSAVKTFTIENTGLAPLNLTGTPNIVSISGANASEFTVVSAAGPVSVAASGSTTFTITFSPTSVASPKSATISIGNDDADENPYTFTVTGDGVTPPIVGWDVNTLIGGTNSFGPSPYTPTTSGANIIAGGLTRGSGVSTTGSAAARAWGGLAWDNAGNASTSTDNITANKFITFTVSPVAGYLLSLSSINPFEYRRSGTGATDALVQYQINAGSFVDITTLNLSSSASAGASVGPVDLSTITALQNISSTSVITFRIVPYGATGSGGTFYIYDVANSPYYDLALNGTVVAAPEINVKQSTNNIASGTGSYAFGSILTGGSSGPVIFTIENTGAANLNLTGTPNIVSIGGADPGEFSINQIASTPVGVGNNTTFEISFNPTTGGNKSASISIANNDADENPYTFTITGIGGTAPEINLKQNTTNIPNSTGSYGFGSVLAGSSSSAITFTIENLGTAALNLTGTPDIVAISGANASEFSINQTATTTPVAISGTTGFTITFSPSLPAGSKTATISIASDDADENPYTFTITGTSTAPEINLKQNTTNIASAGSYSFASTATGSSSAAIPFTIENTGTAPLNLTGSPDLVAISGANANQFSIVQPVSSTISASGSTSFTITFSPTSAGPKTATISIANNDADENPYTFTVNGTGTVSALAAWNVSTLTGGLNNYGVSPYNPTFVNGNVTAVGLTRGSGVTQTGTAAARGWGATGWDNGSLNPPSTSANNIANNKFITFTIKSNPGYLLNLASISPFDYRRSSTGPSSALIEYDIDGGGYNTVTTVSFPVTASSGGSVGSTDLSGISALQNLLPTSVVTIRIVPFGTSSSAGSFYIYDVGNSTANDLAVTGTLTCIAPAATLSNIDGTPAYVCNTNSANVNISFTAGGAPWNYTIQDQHGHSVTGSSSTATATVNIPSAQLPVGTHNFTISSLSTSCSGTGSGTATVVVSSGSVTVPSVISVNVPSSACNGQSGVLITASVAPSTPADAGFSWNTGSNSSAVKFSTSAAGPYVVGPFVTSTPQVYAQFGALGNSSGYNICVQASNGCGSSSNNKCSFIPGSVSTPASITGPSVVCSNSTNIAYTAAASPPATVYTWSYPGATFTTQGNQSVSANFGAINGSSQLCVTAALGCVGALQSPPRCITLSTNTASIAPFSTGLTRVCPGELNSPYTVPAVSGVDHYNWSVPAGASYTPVSPTTSNTINVTFPSPYASNGGNQVCVTASSICGTTTAARCVTVLSGTPGIPPIISGVSYSGLCNQVAVNFNAGLPTGVYTGFTWGGTVITGSPANGITNINASAQAISFNVGAFTTGTLTVTADNTTCTPTTSSEVRSVTLSGAPVKPNSITPNAVCAGFPVSFTPVPAITTNNYSWFFTGGTITGSTTTTGNNPVNGTWGASAGNVQVIASNACGSSGTLVQAISIQTLGCREAGTAVTAGTSLSVYPNPAHDKLVFSINANEVNLYQFQLIDIAGRSVMSQKISAATGLTNYTVDISNLSKGIYLLQVTSPKDNLKTKVIVE